MQSSFFRYIDYTSLPYSWISKLNVEKLTDALENVSTFLGQQIITTLEAESDDLHLIEILKHKIQGELQVYHDYAKKRKSDASHREHALKEKLLHPKKKVVFHVDRSVELSHNDYSKTDYLLGMSIWLAGLTRSMFDSS